MRGKLFLFSLLITGVVSTALVSSSVLAAANRPSANGQGSLTILGENRTFAFSAITRRDGTVSGNVVLHSRHTDTVFHADISCLSVTGNMARMSGTIYNTSNPMFDGWTGFFAVVDNGEGANAAPDEISFYAVAPPSVPSDCSGPLLLPTTPIENGNIQVKP